MQIEHDSRHIYRVQEASPDEVRDAIADADMTFKSGVWSKASIDVRSSVLAQLAQIVADKLDEFAKMESMQTGRPIREMRSQLFRVPEWL